MIQTMRSDQPDHSQAVLEIAAGNASAILDLLRSVAPGWEDVAADEVTAEPLTGGYSGAALYMVSAAGAEPPAVVVRVSGADAATPMTKLILACSDPGVSAAALRAWSHGPTHEDVYCLEDSRFPQVSVTEYIAGRTGDADLMNGKDAIAYCRAMGEAVAWMHTQDAAWFREGIGRHEEQVALQSIDSPTERRKIAALGNYAAYGKYFIDTLVTARLTEGSAAGVAEIGTRVFKLLEPDTLMGRLVVGHGDLKYGNTMIRNTSTADNPQVVLIDYDRVMLLTAGCDLGTYLHDGETRKYPPLASRRALAEGYIEGCRRAGVDLGSLRRCDVDDVVLDMEAGLLMRGLWVSTVTTTVAPNMGWVVGIIREGVSRAADALVRARADDALRQKILEKGAASTVGKGFAIGMMVRAMFSSLGRRVGVRNPAKTRPSADS